MDTFVSILEKSTQLFSPVVDFLAGRDKIISLDLSGDNHLLTADLFDDTNRFAKFIEDRLNAADARFGIGGYNEHRKIYGRSSLFDEGGAEPRRLHLGTDIWGKALEPVMAPLDGIVHSLANNDRPGDYGATIILSHSLGGIKFYSLYGHLSHRSIQTISSGDHITKGQPFAEFGIEEENGNWPPHLHFQLIYDLGGRTGDYPGVCAFSEREQWLLNSPDPEYILQLKQYIQED